MVSELGTAGATSEALGSGTSGGNVLRVAPDKVHAAAQIVQQRADALDAVIKQNAALLQVQPPAANQVVVAVADAWNKAMTGGDESYLSRAKEYLESLRTLQRQLTAAAKRYADHDDNARESFRHHQIEHR